MKLFKSFFGKDAGNGDSDKKDAPQNMQNGLDALKWIGIGENPFPTIRVLDVRPFTMNMTSFTNDIQIATYYAQRDTGGTQFAGKLPMNNIYVECNLTYAYDGDEIPKGALALSRAMEEKWDVFHFDSHITFARSWTGSIHYVAHALIENKHIKITGIEADKEASYSSNEFVVRSVDYLVKSHIFKLPFPNPIPPHIPEGNLYDIAMACFSLYGNRSWFATYDNTVDI